MLLYFCYKIYFFLKLALTKTTSKYIAGLQDPFKDKYMNWAGNFRMVDIGINAWSFLFDNLKINIILQDYLKSVWKTVIIRETAAANQRKADNQMREQKFSHLRKQFGCESGIQA